jgi:hypothetical protein
MNAVTIHKDHLEVLQDFSDADIGRLVRSLAADVIDCEAPQLSPELNLIRKYIHNQNQRFAKQQSDKRKPKEPTVPNSPTPPKEPTEPKQSKPTKATSVPTTVTVSNSVTESVSVFTGEGAGDARARERSGAKSCPPARFFASA